MKKLSKICCSNPNPNDKQKEEQKKEKEQKQEKEHVQSSEDPDSRLKYPLEEPYLTGCNMEVLRIRMRENALRVTETRFLPNGDSHSVTISFGFTATKMTLKIDDQTLSKAKNIAENRGNVELNIDGRVVDFVWNFSRTPMKFSFYTRKYPSDTNAASCSTNNNDDYDAKLDSEAKNWNEHVHIYMVEIFGD